MKFELQPRYQNTPETELIADVIAVSKKLGRTTITRREYAQHGKFHPGTLLYRFNTWSVALKKAGLLLPPVTPEQLFENIADVWTKLGRQPTCQIMKPPLSKYDVGIYVRQFGTWMNALNEFVKYRNSKSPGNACLKPGRCINHKSITAHKNTEKENQLMEKIPRRIRDNLRFRVFIRDGFTCVLCGASPLKQKGIGLHCDHVVPWSKGGKTTVDNLQTLCSACNLGKGSMVIALPQTGPICH